MRKENNLLNIIYETRSRGFENKCFKLYGKPNEIRNVEEFENKIISLIEKNIKDSKLKTEFLDIFNQYQENILGEMIFWDKEYYKLGFLDGINLQKELKKYQNINNKN